MSAKPIDIFEIVRALREMTETRDRLGWQAAHDQWRGRYGDDMRNDLQIMDAMLEEAFQLTSELLRTRATDGRTMSANSEPA